MKKIRFIFLFFSLYLQLIVQVSSVNAAVFPLSEEALGVRGVSTTCVVSDSEVDDYCATQFSFLWTLYTGSKFSNLSVAFWSGTDEYASSKGECGLKFNGKYVVGKKDYIPGDSEFTACFFNANDSLEVLAAILSETRFDYYEPEFKGASRNMSFYVSDLETGTLWHGTIIKKYLIISYLHHIKVSSLRTAFKDSSFGYFSFFVEIPFEFLKNYIGIGYYNFMRD